MAVRTARKPHQRYYARDGTLLPGVTTILSVINKPALPVWANKLGFQRINSTEFLIHVADAGTLSHHLIEARLTGAEQDASGYDDDQVSMAQNALSSFGAWAEGKSLETHETELVLVSEAHRYGGTLDWFGLVDGTPCLIDFKTSARIFDDHLFQLSAYFQLLTENGYEVAEARIVRLSRDASEEFSERVLSSSEIEPYFAVFKAALNLYNAMKVATKRGARRW
ncbi:MAG: hypothetical protein IH822_05560 [Chloroflexi bacterium]|nr:hypothetical protein [Chloroflexota bacterium]